MNTKVLGLLILVSIANSQIGGINQPFSVFGSQCCQNNKITVSGEGVASGQPDIARINAGFEIKARTSEEAVNELTIKIRRAILTILGYGLGNDAYSTQNFNVNPNYDYSSGRRQITGYTARQNLEIIVDQLDSEGTRVARLVDLLAQINGLSISGISFDIQDKTELQSQARQLAFKYAKQKAQDYADFADKRIGRALTIQDNVRVEAAPQEFAKVQAFSVAADSGFGGTNIQVGELDVRYEVLVTFQLRF